MHQQNRGMTIIEVVIVMGLMGILILIFTSLFSTALQTIRYSEDKLSEVLFTQSVKTIMSDLASCQSSLLGVSPGAVSSSIQLPNIKGSDGSIAYAITGQRNKFEKLTIENIRLINRDISPGAPAGRVSLIFNLVRGQKGGGPSNFVTSPIDLRVLMNTTTNQIRGCAANSPTQTLSFRRANTLFVSGFAETEVMTFSLNRLPGPAEIYMTVHMGGTDVVWSTFRLYRGAQQIAEWTDGTSHSLGAAIRSSYIKYNQDSVSGNQNYRFTVERLSNPAYGTETMHLAGVTILFKQ